MKNQKKIVLLILFSIFSLTVVIAQNVVQPVKWIGKVVQIENNIYEVQAIGVFEADKLVTRASTDKKVGYSVRCIKDAI